eukprot:scaffold9824_cov200-Ochromonas_danica.AAC.2
MSKNQANDNAFSFALFKKHCDTYFQRIEKKIDDVERKIDSLSTALIRQDDAIAMLSEYIASNTVSNQDKGRQQQQVSGGDIIVEGGFDTIVSDTSGRVTRQILSLITNNTTLNDIRSVCRDPNYLDSFEHQTIPTTIGYMLCTLRQLKTKNVEIMDINAYEAHKKARKMFTTFVSEAFRKSGEARVLSAGYHRVKTSCGHNNSSIVLDEVSKCIFSELFNDRPDLFYHVIEWASDDERRNRTASRNKRSRGSRKTNKETTILWKQHIDRAALTFGVIEAEIQRVVVDRRNYDRRSKSSKSSIGSISMLGDEDEDEDQSKEDDAYELWKNIIFLFSPPSSFLGVCIILLILLPAMIDRGRAQGSPTTQDMQNRCRTSSEFCNCLFNSYG